MKKLISILIFLLFCMVAGFTASAQGNLQFSKAIFISQDTTIAITGSNTYNSVIVKTISVPQGKVWKIESASALDHVGPSYDFPYLFLENSRLFEGTERNNPPFPIWLPEGNYQIGIGYCSSCTVNYSWWISGIEFSIAP